MKSSSPDPMSFVQNALTGPALPPPGTTPLGARTPGGDTSLGYPRDFFGNTCVYTVLSPRTAGLSVGVNLNPDRQCNLACGYCEVNRPAPGSAPAFSVPVMIAELERTLHLVRSGAFRDHPLYRGAPPALLEPRIVTVSGDGEPTLCPQFTEAMEALIHLRAGRRTPAFKIALLTNATRLDQPAVAKGVDLLLASDEVWAKLEAGTRDYEENLEASGVTVEGILSNIQSLAHRRPVILQSLFPAIHGEAPTEAEITGYIGHLKRLKEAGSRIALVQIYSAYVKDTASKYGHLPLGKLADIARRVRLETGLKAEVF